MFFIKPSLDSGSGRGCKKVDFSKDSITAGKLLNQYNEDIVVQECIICSDDIKRIHESSVNTFRIIIYILEGEVYHCPAIMRIGMGDNFLDNAPAGGIFIAISDDGILAETAFTEFKNEYKIHPTSNTVFRGYKINGFKKIIEAAKKAHTVIPQIGIINWDFTLDENQNPILIEANSNVGSIWLVQMAHGVGGFLDNTPRILNLLKSKMKK